MSNQIRLSEDIKELAMKIGQFYLQKNSGDYAATEKELLSLGITKIETSYQNFLFGSGPIVASITVARPGLFIGKRGENIDKLETFLGIKVKVIEDIDPLYSYLIPYPETEYLDEYYDIG